MLGSRLGFVLRSSNLKSQLVRSLADQRAIAVPRLAVARNEDVSPSNSRLVDGIIVSRTMNYRMSLPLKKVCFDHVTCVRYFASESGRGSPIKATFSWKSFFISLGILSVFFAAAAYYKREKTLKLEKDRRRSLGKASIGGTFELIDHNGKPFTSADLRGKWVLLYFGFSHCPDICPEEMEKMVKVVEKLEAAGGNPPVIPLFISVDPERDTPAVVASYIKEFSPRIIGLTGTKEQVDKATKAYRVYYSAGPRDDENDYIVDHTIIMYLINPDGEFVDYYGQLKTAEQVANGVMLSMAKYNNLKKKSWL